MRMGEISAETAGKLRRFVALAHGERVTLPRFMELIGQALPANDQGMTAEDGAAAILEACGLPRVPDRVAQILVDFSAETEDEDQGGDPWPSQDALAAIERARDAFLTQDMVDRLGRATQ